MPYLFAVGFIIYAVVMAQLADEYDALADEIRDETDAIRATLLAEYLVFYMNESMAVMPALSTNDAVGGYEGMRHLVKPNHGYAVSNNIVGERYTFNRGVMLSQDPFLIEAVGTWSARNFCGGTDITSVQYCPDPDLPYVVMETDDISDTWRILEISKMLTTFDILAKSISKGGAPNETDDGTTLTDGDSVNLPAAVGFLGTANTCSGTFNFDGATLDCRDLYTRDGNAIVYNYSGTEAFELLGETILLDNTGANVLVVPVF